MINLNELRNRAYKCAVEHGWHEQQFSNAHFLCLVVSELMEAVEADRKHKHANMQCFNNKIDYCLHDMHMHGETYNKAFSSAFEMYIKDTVEDELADVVVRILDLAGLRDIDLACIRFNKTYIESCKTLTFTEWCLDITSMVTAYSNTESLQNLMGIFIDVLNAVKRLSDELQFDLIWHVEQKIRYNELRPYKHNNKAY